jgi:DNA ligase-1
MTGGTVARRKLLLWFLLFFWMIPSTLVAASGMMLPQVDDGEGDISGWWMSEKLDGVRGYWDGKRLWSKNGLLFEPPVAFVAGLPEFALEGELWGGRKKFEQTASIVSKASPHDGWLQLQFAIFDVPEARGPFSERIARAIEWFARHPSKYAFVIPQQPGVDRVQMQQELARVTDLGGEGLIVRNPMAPYAAGRNPTILKVKKYEDAEVVVVGHMPGQGENLGRLGSLLVELEDGTRFKIGTGFSAAQRDNPPQLGAVVTFKYYGFYLSGIPKFPSFLRIRGDVGL